LWLASSQPIAAVAELRYSTNGQDFDFPQFEGVPRLRFIIASTPRCGSNLLQRGLWKTGSAGAPEEYLTRAYAEDFSNRFAVPIHSSADASAVDDYIRRLWRIRTSPNGVFGLKLHGSHLPSALDPARQLVPSLQSSSWIWIQRDNKVAQAISYLLADQTGVWIIDREWLGTTHPIGKPRYDRHEIATRLAQVEQEEALWESYFKQNSFQPYILSYEQLVRDYSATLSDVFRFLGLPPPAGFELPGIDQQANAVNHEWEVLFRSGQD